MPHYATPKIVLAHKMYGFPFIDISGEYGVSYRDNHIILLENNKNTKKNLQLMAKFLSTKLALYVFESARYRMRYLERYAFQFLPDITKLPNIPNVINDEFLAAYFNLDSIDIKAISNLHKKKYEFFI